MGIGSEAWDRLFGEPRPAELHPFREIRAGPRHAVATPGDLLFHIRAKRMDLCFEMAAQIMARLGDAVTAVDEVHGFRYFDDRDLLGFVDGTENPDGAGGDRRRLIGAEDPAFAGGSYVIMQKYLHDMAGWNALPTETQERIIGRTKLSDIELDDAVKPTFAHNALTIDRRGRQGNQDRPRQHAFRPASAEGEFGTYFIGYCRSPRTIEQMLENMFIGRPPGNYDRLLDFSRRRDRQSVLRAVRDLPGKRRWTTTPAAGASATSPPLPPPQPASGQSAMVRSASAPSKENPAHE